MILAFEITKVTILKMRHGPDRISLHTTSPCPFDPRSKITQLLCLDFDVTWEQGYDYVTKELEVDPELIEVIDVRTNSEPHCFSRRD